MQNAFDRFRAYSWLYTERSEETAGGLVEELAEGGAGCARPKAVDRKARPNRSVRAGASQPPRAL